MNSIQKKSKNKSLWSVITCSIILSFCACQKHKLDKAYFCGQKYKIWIKNDPKNILSTSICIIFNDNGNYEWAFLHHDSIFYSSDYDKNIGNKWQINKDTFFLGEDIFFPIIQNDTFKFSKESIYCYTDYTDFIVLNGNSINPKSRLSAKGFEKLYTEKYHSHCDTLSRAYFDLSYHLPPLAPSITKKPKRSRGFSRNSASYRPGL